MLFSVDMIFFTVTETMFELSENVLSYCFVYLYVHHYHRKQINKAGGGGGAKITKMFRPPV